MRVARDAGAEVLLITAEPQTPSAALATRVLHVPAQTMARDTGPDAASVLPMGSVFEGALFLLFEVMVLRLRDALAVSPETMRANHTNLE
jgi:6-phospho-3-hexuloisomerase